MKGGVIGKKGVFGGELVVLLGRCALEWTAGKVLGAG